MSTLNEQNSGTEFDTTPGKSLSNLSLESFLSIKEIALILTVQFLCRDDIAGETGTYRMLGKGELSLFCYPELNRFTFFPQNCSQAGRFHIKLNIPYV